MNTEELAKNWDIMTSQERIETVAWLKPFAVKMKFRRLLTAEERELYMQYEQEQRTEQDREQTRSRRLDDLAKVHQFIAFYQKVLLFQQDAINVFKRWDGKALTRTFEKELTFPDMYCQVVYGKQADSILQIEVADIQDGQKTALIVKTEPRDGVFLQKGKRVCFQAEGAIQAVQREADKIQGKIQELTDWEDRIDAAIDAYNQKIKELEELQQAIPIEFRIAYSREFKYISNLV